MPRPSKPKRVDAVPRCCRFRGDTLERDDFYIALTVEEYETVRLIDYFGKTQEECAAFMGIGCMRRPEKSWPGFWWRDVRC